MTLSPPDYLADFDSATAMLRALAAFLRGKDFPNLGLSSALKPVAIGTNLLPTTVRQEVYKLNGYFEAIAPEKLERIRDEDIGRWVVEQYPARHYPAILVGSSNGALVHLAAALGAPWLPQTFLIPLHQRGIEIDEPKQALEFGREPGRRLLEANPDLQLHHMHDANQDRLMTQHMTYFRIKRRRLGEAYARFIAERLERGGVVILVECRHSWPTTRVGPRHVFQYGGAGNYPAGVHRGQSPRRALVRGARPGSRALGLARAGRGEPRGGMGIRAGAACRGYLDQAEPYDEIHLMLFAHGVDSIGLTPIERWRVLLARARRLGRFVEVDERAYPADLAVFARYHPALRQIEGRWPMPPPLSWEQVEEFLGQSGTAGRAGVHHTGCVRRLSPRAADLPEQQEPSCWSRRYRSELSSDEQPKED